MWKLKDVKIVAAEIPLINSVLVRIIGDSIFNPLVPKGSPFDEQNHLALDRVKSIGHYQALKG